MTLESVKYDDQIVSKVNQKRKFGTGYAEPENSKPSWLKNRIDKDRARAGSQSSDLHQQRRSSVKVRKHNRAYRLRRDLDSQSTKPRKVPLEDLIYTSCTDPIPQPAAARTPRLHQPSAVTHLFYAYVRKATDTEFNVFVLGRDLICILGFDSLAKQLRTSLKICE
ncbi:hypothetical protein F511_14645 [Dorcoceras hygrometricum]|uniref:Uncharacterized protein n=1 Tax=Dorcoceras hygrometricum TaxID=472368 RepID=A0A2Z7AU78_9LAMI|nr:hypothetical protein F511_14645 [Dorcoceras hygrometricum]